MVLNEKIYKILLIIFLSFFIIAFLFQIINATKMRLSGDDYCYNAILSKFGFFRMQAESYTSVSMYNGNRYALTFFSGLAGMYPISGTAILTVVSLILWAIGIFLIIKVTVNRLGIKLSFLDILILTIVYICFVLWSTPKLDQSLLWRSGMIPYFLPLVFGTWLLLLVLKTADNPKYKYIGSLLCLLFAFIIGGFSETAAAFVGGFWGLFLIFILTKISLKGHNLQNYLLPSISVIIGIGFAILILYISPSTALRREKLESTLSLMEFAYLLRWNVYVYVWQLVFRRTIHVIIPSLFGLGAGLLYFSNLKLKIKKTLKIISLRTIWQILLIGLSTSLMISFVMLPATYVFSDYPPERVFILSQSIVTLALILIGILLSQIIYLLGEKEPHFLLVKIFPWISFALLFFVLIAPIKFIDTSFDKFRSYNKWARFWDERHEMIINQAQNNQKVIHVIELDSIIEDVGELSPDPDYWYNNCAEMYYGVSAIHADLPGWDN